MHVSVMQCSNRGKICEPEVLADALNDLGLVLPIPPELAGIHLINTQLPKYFASLVFVPPC